MNKTSKPKYLAVVKKRAIEIFPEGVIATRDFEGLCNVSGLSYRRSDGDIQTFSHEARRRLRRWLLTMSVPDCERFALTLTLPRSFDFRCFGPCRPLSFFSGFPASDFSETVRRFGVYLSRAIPDCGLVWRAELQRRGAPHLHCVLWCRGCDWIDALPVALDAVRTSQRRAFRRSSCLRLSGVVIDCWVRAVVQTCFIGGAIELEHFVDGVGVDVEPLQSAPRFLRYVCDHMSKHKADQLGYRGRQWGVVGRSRFVALSSEALRSRRSCIIASRILGKLRRPRVAIESAPFGWRHGRYHPANSGITYAGKETLQRLREYVDTLSLQMSAQTPQALDEESRICQAGCRLSQSDFWGCD